MEIKHINANWFVLREPLFVVHLTHSKQLKYICMNSWYCISNQVRFVAFWLEQVQLKSICSKVQKQPFLMQETGREREKKTHTTNLKAPLECWYRQQHPWLKKNMKINLDNHNCRFNQRFSEYRKYKNIAEGNESHNANKSYCNNTDIPYSLVKFGSVRFEFHDACGILMFERVALMNFNMQKYAERN